MTKDAKLEVEHMISKHNGGTDKIKNLSIACHACNSDKDSMNLDTWLDFLKSQKHPSKLTRERIKHVESFLDGHPIVNKNYAAWVNAYRNYLIKNAYAHTDNVKLATGGRTKFNRTQFELPKDHHIDALCVGEVPESGYQNLNQLVLYVKAMGRGKRLRGNTNACGIITVKYKDNAKTAFGFMSGDIVKAVIPSGKYAGTYTGRITIRKSGSFALTGEAKVPCVSYRYCKLLQRNDGYNYSYRKAVSKAGSEDGNSSPV